MTATSFHSASLLVLLAATSICAAQDASPDSPKDADWIQQRVHEIQPTEADRALDKIGWAKDIRDAEHLAKKHDRPVFLFTHDGHMAIGRC